MWQIIKNIYNLGVKEIRGLGRDVLLIVLIIYSFSLSIYSQATASPETLSKVAIAIVDEDCSQLSVGLGDALLPPWFEPPVYITQEEIDAGMDMGRFTFVLVIPPDFEKDVRAGNTPSIQLNVDATLMAQAFTGQGDIQTILQDEIDKYLATKEEQTTKAATFVLRNRFNPNLDGSWSDGLNALINNITLLAIILTGSALIRERERGTLEHLLVMPVTPFEIMASKIWSMGLVVLVSAGVSLVLVIWGWLGVPHQGSFVLFLAGTALHLFAVTSMGIFLACIAQNMPQLGMLFLLVLLPLQMLSGGSTPVESMPDAVRYVMKAAPTTHFVELSQAILYRGAGLDVVWVPFTWLFGIAAVLFVYSLYCFRKQAT